VPRTRPSSRPAASASRCCASLLASTERRCRRISVVGSGQPESPGDAHDDAQDPV